MAHIKIALFSTMITDHFGVRPPYDFIRKETDVKSHTSEFYDRYTTVRECLVGLNN